MNALLQELQREIQPHHVKGHQNSKRGPSQATPVTQPKKKKPLRGNKIKCESRHTSHNGKT
eukprot:15366073-Ditylum_brightwellii.AAC.1